MTIVQLTPPQLEQARQVAHLRNDHKIGAIRNRRVDQRQNDLDMNIRGLWGEIAVAQLFRVCIDDVQRPGGDLGRDLEIAGRSVQVKYNTYPDGDFYFNSLDEFICELGFLTVPGGRREGLINVVGWITREEFDIFHAVRDYGYGERVIVKQNDLYTCRSL